MPPSALEFPAADQTIQETTVGLLLQWDLALPKTRDWIGVHRLV